MNTDHLVKMVNEISAFFDGESGAEQAPKEVASHLKKFWEKRMRHEIVTYLEKGGTGLTPTARQSVEMLAKE